MNKVLAILASLLRLSAAAGLAWLCAQDLPSIEARGGFDTLPAFDYWKEADTLLNQERFSEALLVTETGLANAPPEQVKPLLEMKKTIGMEQGRWLFHLQQIGRGAITGNGASVEALGGAVVADFFVFGDVRDLVIQAGHKLKGEETDPVIVGLSAGGILTTADPPADLGLALLKFARRMGGLTQSFAKALVDAIQHAVATRKADEVVSIADDLAALSKRSHPAPALAILKNIDDPAELAATRHFSERDGGVFALWLGQKEVLRWIKVSAGNEDLMLKAARHGREGFAYLARNSTLMFRANPLLGMVKGFYKDNIPPLLLEHGRRYSEVVLGFALGWLGFEALLLLGRALGGSRGSRGPTPPPPEPVSAG